LQALEAGIGRMYSVESDTDWLARLRRIDVIKTAESSGRITFQHADIGPVGDWGAPKDETHLKSWPRYYMDVWSKQQFDFELVFIDGRFRTACALMTAVCARDDVIVGIHDYTFRSSYFDIEKYFDVDEASESLIIMKKRATMNIRSLVLDLGDSLFNFS
jgi:hypothetical protein